MRFVQQAVDGADTLHVAAYELTYEPFLELLKVLVFCVVSPWRPTHVGAQSKIAAGVRVTVIFDAKETGKGKKENTVEAEAALAVTGFPADCIIRRRANPSAISHNKVPRVGCGRFVFDDLIRLGSLLCGVVMQCRWQCGRAAPTSL